MRSKEEAADYRYFEEADLPIIQISEEQIAAIKKIMPELPDAKTKRLCSSYGLSSYEAGILIEDRELSDYYEKAAQIIRSKNLINWILRDLMTLLKETKETPFTCKVTPEKIAALISLVDKGTVNTRGGQEIFKILAHSDKEPIALVKELGLEQMSNTEELEKIIKEIINTNPENVALYKSGKDKVFGFFVGQAMQKTKGKADPKIINDLLKKHLS